MGFGFFVVAGGLAAGCYYGYRKLQRVEMEIRDELRAKGLAADQDDAPPAAKEKPVTSKPVTPIQETSQKSAVEGSLEERILAKVKENPGVFQTELYKQFPDGERKAVQAELLKMDKAGTLRRTKEKGTYRLESA